MKRKNRGAVVVTITMLSAACYPAPDHGGAAADRTHPEAIATDPSILAPLVRAIMGESPSRVVRVDPRLLEPDSNIGEARAEDMAVLPEDVLEQRVQILEELGVQWTDAIRDSRCYGDIPLYRDDPVDTTEECPEEDRYYSVIFGVAREGGPHWPDLGVDDRDSFGPGLWVVRSVERAMSPQGAVWSAVDNVLRRDSRGRWEMVERRFIIGE